MKRVPRKMKVFITWTLSIALAFLMTGCQPVCHKMEPVIPSPLPTCQVETFPSAFPALTQEEREEEWAKELVIAEAFSRECDFYRAITCYKRARILLPAHRIERQLQIDYDLMLCYYLGGKYQEVLTIFESSDLSQANPVFPAFNHLLLIVYDAYLQTHQEDKAGCVLEIIGKFAPEVAGDLSLYQELKMGNVDEARMLVAEHPNADTLQEDFSVYDRFAKSPRKARMLNAVLPGAGYAYVGLKRSAITSFVINALFTAAAYQCFRHGQFAWGAIATSLEMGWYLGGINGAGIEAQEFNTRLYEGVSKSILNKQKAFPVLMFETSF